MNTKKITRSIDFNGLNNFNSRFYLDLSKKFVEIIEMESNSVVGRIEKFSELSLICFQPESRNILAYMNNQTICVWNFNKFQTFSFFQEENLKNVSYLQILGKNFVTVDPGCCRLWDMATDKFIKKWGFANSQGTVVKVSNDFTHILFQKNETFSIVKFQFGNSTQKQTFSIKDASLIDINKDFTKFVCACSTNFLVVHDIIGDKQIAQKNEVHSGMILALVLSLDERQMITAGEDRAIKIWSSDTLEMQTVLEGHKSGVHLLAFVGAEMLISADTEHTIALWNLTTKMRIGEILSKHSDSILAIKGNPNSKELVSVGKDKTLKYWNIEGGVEISSYNLDVSEITHAIISEDISHIIALEKEKVLVHWNRTLRKPNTIFESSTDYSVNQCWFSPDGATVIGKCSNGLLAAWNLNTNEMFFKEKNRYFSSCDFCSEKLWLAGGMDNGSILVWDFKELKVIFNSPETVPPSPALSINISVDQNMLISGDRKGFLYHWELNNEKECKTKFKMTEPNAFMVSSKYLENLQKVLLLIKYAPFYSDDDPKKTSLRLWDLKTNTIKFL